MALNTTGTISIGGDVVGESINLEFARASTATTSMSQLYRGGAVVPEAAVNSGVPTSGAISLSQLRGATRRLSFTVPVSATQNYVANTAKVTGYVAGISDVTFLVTGNVGSASTSSYAFEVDASWNAGDNVNVTVNSGVYVSGMGGNGGEGPFYAHYGRSLITGHGPGYPGGPALLARRNISITNNGVIQGGGGGGGSSPQNGTSWSTVTPGKPPTPTTAYAYVNGAAGGGGGGLVAGTGGAKYPGQAFSSEWGNDVYTGPGSPGTLTAGGAGYPSVASPYAPAGYLYTIAGGNGGNPGANGAASPDRAGGNAGYATAKTAGVTITWNTPGARYGTVDASV